MTECGHGTLLWTVSRMHAGSCGAQFNGLLADGGRWTRAEGRDQKVEQKSCSAVSAREHIVENIIWNQARILKVTPEAPIRGGK